MLSLSDAALVAVATWVGAFGATWAVRGAMRRTGIFDRPASGPDADRKLHDGPVAYEGGIALHLAVLLGLVVAAFLDSSLFFDGTRVRALILGATAATALGVADDLLHLSALPKLLGQGAIALFMWQAGYGVERLSNPFGAPVELWPAVSLAGTVLWYALLMNGLNLIDGLDGLAAGIAAICAATLAAIALELGMGVAFAVALVTAAACLGFLPFNFSPASIFMGDAGSLLLGFLLASTSLLSSTKAPALLALVIPMVAVGVPLFETAFSFLRRAAQGKHPFRGDRRHLHHRFLALGFSPRRAVLTFYYLTACFGVVAYVLQRLEGRATLAMVAMIGAGMVLLVENLRFLERRPPPESGE